MRRIVFLTGTRADFGKLKSLIEITLKSGLFEIHIFATGMHMNSKYGRTVDEIYKCGYDNIYSFINHHDFDTMDSILANTIQGFSNYIKEIKPDLIVIHGDRCEALAGAIVGALNNVLVGHIEGGEVSGTIDELIRHAVSKMSHIHFVSNETACRRLIQMGELPTNIFVIGSPDIDVMLSPNLPKFSEARSHYAIPFEEYGLALFHPVTTEVEFMENYARQFVDALLQSHNNYVIVYPNNDLGSIEILKQYERLKGINNIKIFPSIRFEYFLVILKNARFLIGNSSAGIREAPYYGIPTINIGSRQNNRALHSEIINSGYSTDEILAAIEMAHSGSFEKLELFGTGNSNELFLQALTAKNFWQINKQKQFKDLVYTDAQIKAHSQA